MSESAATIRRHVWSRIVALALVGVLVGGTALGATHRAAAAPQWVTTAKQRLSNLQTKSEASMTGFDRDKFGPNWYDADLNGCDTRNDILVRDLKNVTFKPGSDCKVAKGTLHDRYTGTTISFVQGKTTSSAVQIDHVVALAAAWRTGAKQWPPSRRLFYANDGVVLLAVDGPANNVKTDKDASEWMPTNLPYRCRFIATQVAIKTKYELWVTQQERATMVDVLNGCS